MNDRDGWRADKSQKANAMANDISVLAARARGSGLEIVGHILELAAREALKEAEQYVDRTP